MPEPTSQPLEPEYFKDDEGITRDKANTRDRSTYHVQHEAFRPVQGPVKPDAETQRLLDDAEESEALEDNGGDLFEYGYASGSEYRQQAELRRLWNEYLFRNPEAAKYYSVDGVLKVLERRQRLLYEANELTQHLDNIAGDDQWPGRKLRNNPINIKRKL